MNAFIRRLFGLGIALLLADTMHAIADAQEIFAGKFGQQTGEELYKSICQGCHMSDARGAVGAGAYPALANNPRLAAAVYPITVVLNGQRAMPTFGDANPPFYVGLTDMQIANVLNYVRTHFGNHYKDTITPEAVKAARHPSAPRPADTDTSSGLLGH
jgi:mono/diheme cytochrome c family protein